MGSGGPADGSEEPRGVGFPPEPSANSNCCSFQQEQKEETKLLFLCSCSSLFCSYQSAVNDVLPGLHHTALLIRLDVRNRRYGLLHLSRRQITVKMVVCGERKLTNEILARFHNGSHVTWHVFLFVVCRVVLTNHAANVYLLNSKQQQFLEPIDYRLSI